MQGYHFWVDMTGVSQYNPNKVLAKYGTNMAQAENQFP